jgi:hypothetical protein
MARGPFMIFANVDQYMAIARHLLISGDIDFLNPRLGVIHQSQEPGTVRFVGNRHESLF